MKKPLSTEDQQALERACRDDTDRMLLWGILDTGCRIKEWCDIDGRDALTAAKTGELHVGNRIVPASKRLTQLLTKYFATNPVGSRVPLRPRAAEYRLRELEEIAKIKSRVTPATLRLTFVATAIERGVDEQSIRAALGSWPSSVRRLCEKMQKKDAAVASFRKHGW